MEIKRRDGSKELRFYDTVEQMMEDAEKEAKNPETRKLILHFPKLLIPGQKKKKRLSREAGGQGELR